MKKTRRKLPRVLTLVAEHLANHACARCRYGKKRNVASAATGTSYEACSCCLSHLLGRLLPCAVLLARHDPLRGLSNVFEASLDSQPIGLLP